MDTLIIRAPFDTERPMYLSSVRFLVGTDGVVDVTGRIDSHTFGDAPDFLTRPSLFLSIADLRLELTYLVKVAGYPDLFSIKHQVSTWQSRRRIHDRHDRQELEHTKDALYLSSRALP